MGTALVLEVPEAEQSKQVIYDYYEHVLNKERAVGLATEDSRVENRHDYAYVLENFEEKGKFYIWQRFYRDIVRAVGWENIEELFGLREDGADHTISEREDLEHLIELLREAKPTLKEEKPERNWEGTFETQVIALPEFALEHGYEVRLSY